MTDQTTSANYDYLSKLIVAYQSPYSRPDMPWRKTKDPYKIWISEVMLQQTQVVTVLNYYDRFIREFPNVASLAAATEDQVFRLWAGLGYYHRAKNLINAANIIVQEYQGQFPSDFNQLLTLPGIGKYTAAAIMSFAFNEQYPAIDANIKRVIHRLFAIEKLDEKHIWQLTLNLMKGKPSRVINLNLMDLGAMVCRAKNPDCLLCSLKTHCQAFIIGSQNVIPPPKKRREKQIIQVATGVIVKKGQYLIQKRPMKGLFPGMWEFPGGKIQSGEIPEEACIREINEELGIDVKIKQLLMTHKHAYTKFLVNLHVFICEIQKGKPKPKQAQQLRWADLEQLDDLPFPAANQKIIQQLKKEH